MFPVTIETEGAPKAQKDSGSKSFELTVPAGARSPRQESIAVNGRRELCGLIRFVCPQSVRKHRLSQSSVKNELFTEPNFSET